MTQYIKIIYAYVIAIVAYTLLIIYRTGFDQLLHFGSLRKVLHYLY